MSWHDSPCEVWGGTVTSNGYARKWRRDHWVRVHIERYEAAHGPVPDRYELDHLCRVRLCVNPAHLEVVTRGENIRRGLKGWSLTGRCRSGLHDVTDERNVIHRANGRGRICGPCKAIRDERANERKRASRAG